MARAFLVAIMTLLLVACGGRAEPTGELSGNRVDPPFDLVGTPLTDTAGDDFSLTADTDKDLTLVFFGYTNCPDICGQVMMTLAGAMKRLSADDRERVDVVFVTTDPARDTADVVADYTRQFDPAFIGLTGDLDDIIGIGRSVGVGVDQEEKLPSGGYEVTHGTQIMAVDDSDTVPVYWSEEVSPATLADDIHLLLAEG